MRTTSAGIYRRIIVGLISAVPNLLPLALILGLMGWTGIQLDMTTVMIAPLLLGIVVDDTVHMIERVLIARQRGRPVEDAFRVGVAEVGHAVLITTVILSLGFLTPIIGSFKPTFYFALLCSLALTLALLADLIIFPAIACPLPWLIPGRSDDDNPQ